MHDADLGLKMLVGPDEVSVVKKQQHSLIQLDGVPVFVNPNLMDNEEGHRHYGVSHTVGGDHVSIAQ